MQNDPNQGTAMGEHGIQQFQLGSPVLGSKACHVDNKSLNKYGPTALGYINLSMASLLCGPSSENRSYQYKCHCDY